MYFPPAPTRPHLRTDFYKIDHVSMYPLDMTRIYSNSTARYSKTPGAKGSIFLGLNKYIKEYLLGMWQDGFFRQPLDHVLAEYRAFIKATLFVDNPRTDHIEALHALGKPPIKIWALPEGTYTPLGVPQYVMTSTRGKEFGWFTNFLETQMQSQLWKPGTNATIARSFYKMLMRHALESGETDLSFLQWQGHDFSMRGMSGCEDAANAALGHLMYFSGTDTIPAIFAAHDYYGADFSVGGSVAATEHSVMCAGSQAAEMDTIERLLCEVYPGRIVSVVMDTWDLWNGLSNPRLKAAVEKFGGKFVARPDSGDPVTIMLGDNYKSGYVKLGAIRTLERNIGSFERPGKLRLIGQPHPIYGHTGGLIYGDGINEERGERILTGTRKHGFSPYNIVFGIGSYSYQMNTRDTYGIAMKATAIELGNGELQPMFKDPVTDDGGKRSAKGIVAAFRDPDTGQLFKRDGLRPEDLNNCAFQLVLNEDELLVDPTWDSIRKLGKAELVCE